MKKTDSDSVYRINNRINNIEYFLIPFFETKACAILKTSFKIRVQKGLLTNNFSCA